jgi:hypothetical protein
MKSLNPKEKRGAATVNLFDLTEQFAQSKSTNLDFLDRI